MNTKQVIVVRKDLNIRKGKIAAQVAHASMAFLLEQHGYSTVVSLGSMDSDGGVPGSIARRLSKEEWAWLKDPDASHAKVVCGIDSERELTDLCEKAEAEGIVVHKIIDAGRTEFNGVPTLTCAAFGPHRVDRFSGVTDHLKLL